MKKGILLVLSLILGVLQYRLWYGEGSLLEVMRLNQAITEEQGSVSALKLRNQTLEGEVQALKKHPEALEERARSELGMIKRGETFFIVVEPAR